MFCTTAAAFITLTIAKRSLMESDNQRRDTSVRASAIVEIYDPRGSASFGCSLRVENNYKHVDESCEVVRQRMDESVSQCKRENGR